MISMDSEFDKKINRMSRKVDLEVYKENVGFDAELKKLDKKIEKISKEKIRSFDEFKKPYSNYFGIDYTDDYVESVKKRLDNL